ncbi:MAG: hypothetical protein EOM50_01750 [Erysipelotrichia bacterium]|nr:hypothetical protein [Erysipelotrichia bacterium]
MSGEGYDFASIKFDVAEFYQMKGVDNLEEYIGKSAFNTTLETAMLFLMMKEHKKDLRNWWS